MNPRLPERRQRSAPTSPNRRRRPRGSRCAGGSAAASSSILTGAQAPQVGRASLGGLTTLAADASCFATRSPAHFKNTTGREFALVDLIRGVDDPAHGLGEGEERDDAIPVPPPGRGDGGVFSGPFLLEGIKCAFQRLWAAIPRDRGRAFQRIVGARSRMMGGRRGRGFQVVRTCCRGQAFCAWP